jgi:cation transporter-like permease
MTSPTRPISKSHMPENSVLFEKIIPIALIALGVITVALMLFATGVVFGIVRF